MDTAGDDPPFGTAGMGKFVVPYINTDMIDFAPIGFSGIKKDQVPVLKFIDGDSFAAF